MAIKTLQLTGSPYEMGYAHGEAFRDLIREYTAERVHLSGSSKWAGRPMSRDEIINLAEAMVEVNQAYAPDLMEEIRGIADATDLTPAELVVTNGFTDFVDVVYTYAGQTSTTHSIDDCTAFMVANHRTADHQGFIGQTWDMHDSAAPYVVLLDAKPDNGPAFLCFTTMGCIGQIGMNTAGIAVGINNIMGEGQVGVIWNFVIRKILAQDNIEDALSCITSAHLAGAHNYLLMDKYGNGYNVEAMADRYHVDKLGDDLLLHTNHCVIDANQRVERERPPESRESSLHRLARAGELLAGNDVTIDDLIELTRDDVAICVSSKPPLYTASLGATIMRPASGEFWAVQGSPRENDYERFVV